MAIHSTLLAKCNVCRYRIPLRLAKLSRGRDLEHDCDADDWSVKGQFTYSEMNFHVAENIAGIGMAAVLGVGFRVSPSSRGLEGTIEIDHINRADLLRGLQRRDQLGMFRYLDRYMRRELDARVANIILNKEFWVNCFQCHDEFVPRDLVVEHGDVNEDQFLHNTLCSEACQKAFQAKILSSPCLGCNGQVELIEGMEASPTQSLGFCSKKCFDSQRKKTCVICSKDFVVIQTDAPGLRKYKRAAHQIGLCGLSCYADNLRSIGRLKLVALRKRSRHKYVAVRCTCDRMSKVPISHKSKFYLCVYCGEPRELLP